MLKRSKFAQIIIPVPVKGSFTYEIPISLVDDIKVGQSVVVQFGVKKLYTGIVESITAAPPDSFKIKTILSISNPEPTVTQQQLEFWQWVANYYMCPIGDVYKAAVPVGLRPDSESKIIAVSEPENPSAELSEEEKKLYAILLKEGIADIEILEKKSEIKQPLNIVKQLIDKGFALITEEVRNQRQSRKQKTLKFASRIDSEETLNRTLALLTRSEKQRNVLSWMANFLGNEAFTGKTIQQKVVIEKVGVAPTIVKSLVDKGFLVEEFEDALMPNMIDVDKISLNPLNEFQQKAFEQINTEFEQKQAVLLHGITGSGKTEIYIHLIEATIKAGKRVLYLLPEIALTTQIVMRLKRFFGNYVGVYHSKHSSTERVELWNNQLKGKFPYPIILGVRSSIFLPIDNLGLIIVDEEHESSYKQFEPSPRYNARDLAIVLAMQKGAKVLLGSATPSLESYYNAQNNRYGLVELNRRHGEAVLPQTIVVDTQRERKKKLMTFCFSQTLLSSIDDALIKGEQVILFQNRRGYSPFLECSECGYVPKCKHCDVSLTYHKSINKLVCHYCGYIVDVNNSCPHCHQNTMQLAGFGTERVEDELKKIFPKARIARLDTDTTRTKHGSENIIRDFQEQQIDILIGTQMVTKGLDFDKVSIVGVLNADNMLSFPDFRAFERGFQTMAQVSGRAGRKEKQGTVIIQTSTPDSTIINQVVTNDFIGMYNAQLQERSNFFYPPISRIISITLKHRDKKVVDDAALYLFKLISQIKGLVALGPTTPVINRIQSLYLMNILVKIAKTDSVGIKNEVQEAINFMLQIPSYKSVVVVADVDPM